MGHSSKNPYPPPPTKRHNSLTPPPPTHFPPRFLKLLEPPHRTFKCTAPRPIQISIKLLDAVLFNLHSNYIPFKGGDEIISLSTVVVINQKYTSMGEIVVTLSSNGVYFGEETIQTSQLLLFPAGGLNSNNNELCEEEWKKGFLFLFLIG